jgi:hypothetical protein
MSIYPSRPPVTCSSGSSSDSYRCPSSLFVENRENPTFLFLGNKMFSGNDLKWRVCKPIASVASRRAAGMSRKDHPCLFSASGARAYGPHHRRPTHNSPVVEIKAPRHAVLSRRNPMKADLSRHSSAKTKAQRSRACRAEALRRRASRNAQIDGDGHTLTQIFNPQISKNDTD